jgi:hypothetical protein
MKLKKLSVLLAAAMIMSFAACGNSEEDPVSSGETNDTTTSATTTEPPEDTTAATTDSSGEDTTAKPDNNSEPSGISGTRTYAALGDIFGGDTFSMVMEMGDYPFVMHRRGDDVYAEVFDMKVLIVDGYYHLFSEGAAYRINTNDSEELGMMGEMMIDVDDLGMFPDFGDMTLLDSGTADFMGEELYFEELEEPNGALTRYFFDGDKLVGMASDDVIQLKIISFSANVPADAFEIPEGYEVMDFADYMQNIMSQFS